MSPHQGNRARREEHDYKRLRQAADSQTEEDRRQLGQGDARADKSKDGVALFSNGFNYVTHEKYDLGLPMIERGVERGGLKHVELARLELGIAYVLAGRKDDALRALAAVKGDDGSADLAHLWTLYLKGKS